jgi:splicing factor U2AF subunit
MIMKVRETWKKRQRHKAQGYGTLADALIEICDDVRDECSKYGQIVAIKVPRPVGGSRQSAGVGKIFVKYDTPESATKALKALAGRKFADRTVVTTYFPEENFEVGAW